MSLLTQICRYRELLHERDTGNGLDIANVLALEALESGLQARAGEAVEAGVRATLTDSKEHRVGLSRLGPAGVVCSDCPRLVPHSSLGLRLDDAIQNLSYLFRVEVAWVQHVNGSGECLVGLDFVGPPVLLRWTRGRGRSPEVVVELESKLSAA